MYEVREVLRLWLRGEGVRATQRLAGVDRKTVRRYLAAAIELGLDRDGGEGRLDDEFLGRVVEKVRPHRLDGHGAAWRCLEEYREQIREWVEKDDLTTVKVGEFLARRGVVVPARTLDRFVVELCGPRRGRAVTVRVADGAPGRELQVDFGRMGLIPDPATGRRRVLHALIFTACVSRHCFVWPTFAQTTAAVIEGFEAAWAFFGGVFHVVVPDNLTPVIDKADPLEPRFNQAFAEYAQDRGFLTDPARVRRPQDKPRVERQVSYVRRSWFAGEVFVDLADARVRAETWCRTTAGLRVHGTTAARPAQHFALVEAGHLLPVPTWLYDLPIYARPKVHRDHHIEVARALYSVPGALIGARVDVRADGRLVKIFHRGVLVKSHPRQPAGGRSTDPGDLPADKSVYALRDLDRLQRLAAGHAPAIGAYAAVLLDHPLPWTKMRQVYALLGLVAKWGPDRVELACARAAEAEAFSVALIGRMLARGLESDPARQTSLFPPPAPPPSAAPPGGARFARPAAHFAARRPAAAVTDGAGAGHDGGAA
ncbi:MAG TPA: IS21 family transposase [Kineosporiaceae bacterium]